MTAEGIQVRIFIELFYCYARKVLLCCLPATSLGGTSLLPGSIIFGTHS